MGVDCNGPPMPALQDVSVEVSQGSLVAVLGPHGIGKYTLLRLVAGIVKPTSGHIQVPTHLACLCLPKQPQIFASGSLLDNLTFGTPNNYNESRLIKLCQAAGLGNHTMT